MIVLEALRKTFEKKFWAIFSSTIGGAITFFGVGKTFMKMSTSESIGLACFVGLGIIVLRFTYVVGSLNGAKNKATDESSLMEEIKNLKETINKQEEERESFEQVLEYLNTGFSAVHWLRTQEKNRDKYLGILEFLCCQLKYVFDERTGSKCAISIKIPVHEEEEMTASTRVMNICRDKWSLRRNTDEYKAKPHYVYNNTPFNNICIALVEEEVELPYYFNNDITTTHGYQNSSEDTYVEGGLAYKSEIVVPIIPYNKPAGTRFVAAGFLCLDSVHMNAFDKNIDVPILQGVADCIHDLIKLREGLLKPEQFLIVENRNANIKATPFTIKDLKPNARKDKLC